MDTQSVELLLDELGIPPPANAVRTRATLDRLGELDVPLNPEQPRHYLAGQLRGMVDRGEVVTGEAIVEMVHENRLGGDHVEAGQVLQLALEDAERLHELALTHSAKALLPVVGARIADVYAKVRKLPGGIPTSAGQAVRANAAGLEAFRGLEALSARHSKLRQLHRLLVADRVDNPAALVMFGDTKLSPAPGDWPTTRQAPMAVGPKDSIPRLVWLTDPHNEAWTPTAAELNEHYWSSLRAIQKPATAVSA